MRKLIYSITVLIGIGFYWKFYVSLDVKEMSRLPLIIFEHNFIKSNYNYKLTKPNSPSGSDLDTIYISANPTDDNVIQNAIDNINSGNIFLTDSVYFISSPILLKSNVCLIGLNKYTKIINRVNSFSDVVQKIENISDSLYFIHFDKIMSDIVGQNIFIGIHNSGGWNRAIFKIINSKNKSHTAKLILNSSDLNVKKGNVINSQNSFVLMNNIKNSGLKNIEFSLYENQCIPDWHRKDFLNSGIVIINSERILMDSVKVNNYLGEGVSVQGGSNNYFSYIECINNLASGFHLGTGSKGTKIINSTFSLNKGDGIYFCAKVENCIIENNIINGNFYNGIGGLGGSGDRGNIIISNKISFNKKYGIHLYETNNKISNNIFVNNILFKSNNEFGNLIEHNSFN